MHTNRNAPTKHRLTMAPLLLCILASFLHPGCSCAPEPPCLRVICDAGQRCEEGKCVSVCEASQSFCDGACVNTQTDNKHCGKCSLQCPSTQLCQQGQCTTCPKEQSICNNTCVDFQTNDNHCGTCGNTCKDGLRCKEGTCSDVWITQVTGLQSHLGFTHIARNSKGDIYTCGQSKGALTVGTKTFSGQNKLTIAMFTSDGTFAWGKAISSGAASCNILKIDKLDQLYLSGTFETPQKFGTIELTTGSIYLLKLTPKGDVLWAKSLQLGQNGSVLALFPSLGGDLLIGGKVHGEQTLGKITVKKGQTGEDGFIARLNPKGDYLWVADTQLDQKASIYGLVEDSKGTLHVSGGARGPGKLFDQAIGAPLVSFYATLNPQGQWQRAQIYSQSFWFNHLVLGPQDQIYMVGGFEATIEAGSTVAIPVGPSDTFFAQLDDKGAFVWARQLGSKNVWRQGGKLLTNGTSLFTGGNLHANSSYSGKAIPNKSSYGHLFTMEMDLQGEMKKRHYQGNSVETLGAGMGAPTQGTYLHDIAVDAKGNIYTIGTFSHELPLQPLPLKNKTGWSLYIAKNLP